MDPYGGATSMGHAERQSLIGNTRPSTDSDVSEGVQRSDGEAELTMGLRALVESLLFVADGPVTPGQLARALGVPSRDIEDAVTALAEEYRTRGLRVQRDDGRLQIVTAPEAASHIEQFLGLSMNGRLSNAALEVLAVIAYQQPTTRAQVEAVRGVDCGGVLRTLAQKGFIDQLGRLEQAGRPIVYGTTFQFLRYFGLESLDDLPPMPQDEPMSQ
jgi:segregation and condensation protein B